MSGKLPLPFLQRQSWINAQNRDRTHIQLKQLIKTSQAPEKKKTRDENTKLKKLYNLYREGKLKVHKDGLVTITHTDQMGSQYQAVSVPTALFPGLIHALHFKLSHPSKIQLGKLVSRHFYTLGYQRIIDEVTDSCEMCAALKQLPKEVFSESTGPIDGFGTNFSADVIERNSQQILIVREKLSSFTFTTFISDQTAESLKQSLISLILDFVPEAGSIVQVDCATAWATLEKESANDNSDLKKLNIKIDLGRHHNKNKNPVSDNACKEFHKELLRLKPEGSALTEIERAMVTSNMNKRIRKSGLSSKEICFKRDLITNNDKPIDDKIVAGDIIEAREKQHNKPSDDPHGFEIGHNVFLKNDKSKLKARQLYRIVEIYSKDNETWATIQKHDSQFRAKQYEVKLSEIMLLPGQNNESRPKRKAALKARETFAKARKVIKKPKPTPTNGWDYEKLLEQIQFDDEETWYQYHENQNLPPEIDEDNIDSDDTPTNESSSSEHEEFEDANDAESESSSTVTDNSEDPPPIPVRLPIDMNVRQNLAQELQHPEVQAAVDDLVGDLREFNSRHPKAPPLASTIYKRSARNNSKPQNYATMDKEEIENRRKKK